MVRLVVLRLSSARMLYAKEVGSPVVLTLVMLEPLSDPQLRHIANASPWAPVVIEATIDDTWLYPGFGANVTFVETMPKIPIIAVLLHQKSVYGTGCSKESEVFCLMIENF